MTILLPHRSWSEQQAFEAVHSLVAERRCHNIIAEQHEQRCLHRQNGITLTDTVPRAITERKVCSELSPRLPRMGAILQPPIRPEIRRIAPPQLLSAVQCADRNHEVFPLLDDDAVNGAAVLGDYRGREWYHIIARRHACEIIEGGSETDNFADHALKVRHFVLHLLKGWIVLKGRYFCAQFALAREIVRQLVQSPGQSHGCGLISGQYCSIDRGDELKFREALDLVPFQLRIGYKRSSEK